MANHKREPDVSGTFAGITTPEDQQDIAATDKISDYVEAMMDQLEGEDEEAPRSDSDHGHATNNASGKPRLGR
ncbi:hypothetical protein [Paenibacillus puerhi]|uniref:hypothetical protein n=1 Tax=Paenibacillus puerhi TaxID=2692622 RepID=UPI001357927A|nr:hypothetical protein [Paenibacillus puerhi]